MTPTKSGILNIENSTRYNTDDIVRLFSAYEDGMQARGIDPVLHENTPTTVDVVDYKPASLATERNVWDNESNRYVTKAVHTYVKEGSFRLTQRHLIGLVPPDMLYENPIEALTQVDNDTAPNEFVVQLVGRIALFYDYPRGSDGYMKRKEVCEMMASQVAAGEYPLHIEKAKPKGTVGGVRLRKARATALSSSNRVIYNLCKAQVMVADLKHQLSVLQHELKAAQVPSALDHTTLASVKAVLNAFEAQVGAAKEALQ
jgi:hypothetical protein